jgi:DNA-binding CsgD family transcriptional regulator
MLGFVRNGLSAVNPPDALATFLLMSLAFIVLFVWRRGVSLGFFFQVGVLCMTVGILLAALFDVVAPLVDSLLMWASSTCLEIVAMMLCIWITHHSNEPLIAAATSRSIMVLGHLAGTVLIVFEGLLESSLLVSTHAAEAILLLLFIMLLLFSYRTPTLQVLFFSVPPSDFDSKVSTAGQPPAAAVPAVEAEAAGGVEASTLEDQWRSHRQLACSTVADTYKLTKRETDLLYELSEGRSVSYMAERFVLSPNTVKMHIRHIYQKLDVHSKQEVIDIVNAAGELESKATDARR